MHRLRPTLDGPPCAAGWGEQSGVTSALARLTTKMEATGNRSGTCPEESFSVALEPGVHQLESDRSFGLIVYAYDDYVSYAFPGGLDLIPKIKE